VGGVDDPLDPVHVEIAPESLGTAKATDADVSGQVARVSCAPGERGHDAELSIAGKGLCDLRRLAGPSEQ